MTGTPPGRRPHGPGAGRHVVHGTVHPGRQAPGVLGTPPGPGRSIVARRAGRYRGSRPQSTRGDQHDVMPARPPPVPPRPGPGPVRGRPPPRRGRPDRPGDGAPADGARDGGRPGGPLGGGGPAAAGRAELRVLQGPPAPAPLRQYRLPRLSDRAGRPGGPGQGPLGGRRQCGERPRPPEAHVARTRHARPFPGRRAGGGLRRRSGPARRPALRRGVPAHRARRLPARRGRLRAGGLRAGRRGPGRSRGGPRPVLRPRRPGHRPGPARPGPRRPPRRGEARRRPGSGPRPPRRPLGLGRGRARTPGEAGPRRGRRPDRPDAAAGPDRPPADPRLLRRTATGLRRRLEVAPGPGDEAGGPRADRPGRLEVPRRRQLPDRRRRPDELQRRQRLRPPLRGRVRRRGARADALRLRRRGPRHARAAARLRPPGDPRPRGRPQAPAPGPLLLGHARRGDRPGPRAGLGARGGLHPDRSRGRDRPHAARQLRRRHPAAGLRAQLQRQLLARPARPGGGPGRHRRPRAPAR